MAKKNNTGKKTLSELQAELEKTYGENALVSMDGTVDASIQRIPTGVVALDSILGGGLPRGKMAEFFGPEGCGKSSIAMRFVAEAQKVGRCVYVDLENAFDPHIAEMSGIDLHSLMVSQPESAETALQIIETVLTAEDVSAIIVDSVAGLVPQAEIEGDYGDSHMGLHARLLSQATRKLSMSMQKNNSQAVLLWINQIREKIGGMPSPFPVTTTTGGRALRFWCSTRVEVKRRDYVKQGENIVGHTVSVKSVKNRFAAPFQTASFDIIYDSGISNSGTVVDEALKLGIFTKSGAWIADSETGESLGQGRLNTMKKLDGDPELLAEVSARILSAR